MKEDSARSASGDGPPKTIWAWAVGTFFGAGLIRPGPGTWGSLAAAAIWYFGLRGAHLTGWAAVGATLAGALAVTLIGIPAATRVERESGREDPGFVVIDEVAGQWLALAAAPLDLRHGIAAFVLFRVFDIVKPWPARQLEQLPGGAGIVLDDLAAGAYALGVMLVVRHWG
ncbi:MAG TPA: phosphatidylglycerophosphatase A [Acidobacteriaceae bacterium]|nr:phosphatidylglycerophosphatase A [Acidobacteriaceae bacterium]